MTRVNEAEPNTLASERELSQESAGSRSRLVASPAVSDIRSLAGPNEGHCAGDDLLGCPSGIAPQTLDLFQIRCALEEGSDLFIDDPELGAALFAADPRAAIVRLFDEIRARDNALRVLNEDLHALKKVNSDLEQQLLDALAGADDTRVSLMDALERASDETLSREAEIVSLLDSLAAEVERSRAQFDEFEIERANLHRQLSAIGSATQ